MEPQIMNLDILIEALDIKEQFSMFMAGFLLQNIRIRVPTEINNIYKLIQTLNTAIADNLISKKDRRSIIQKLLKDKYSTVQLFEKSLNTLFEETVNTNLLGDNNNAQEQDASQKLIQELLKREEEERLRKQQADADSELLIKQIQLKEQISQNKRLEEASKTEIKIDCPICLEEIKLVHLALLACKHSFHRECILGHFVQGIKERKVPLKCPDCSEECYDSDISQYLSNQYMEVYDKISFENYVNMHHEDMSWCPTAGCQYVFSFDEDQTEFNCPLCRNFYCLKCKVPYHKGMSCKQFNINRVFDKNDQQFIQFVKGAKYKQCPSCKFWVQKNDGCDHMTCRCHYEFCYVCGGKYQACDCMNRQRNFMDDDDDLLQQGQRIDRPIRRVHDIQRPRPPQMRPKPIQRPQRKKK